MASAHNQTVGRMSPRQKMINLMYIVLTAMLALNVSSDVLNGFSQVQDGLDRSNRTISQRNQQMLAQLAAFKEENPEKGEKWLLLARSVRNTTDQLYDYIDTLKMEIAREADGPEANLASVQNKDNLDASSHVMLDPITGKGKDLKARIDKYREYVLQFIADKRRAENIAAALSTAPYKTGEDIASNKTWQDGLFENMPVVASLTLLSKIQNDVKYAEGEVLNTLITNVDLGDIRVNEVSAFVVPESRIVMKGGKYSANIVLAAVDTTQRPSVYVNGQKLANDRGLYQVGAGSPGNHEYSGYIEVPAGDGSMTRLPFKSSYTVIEPMATISATMMNVLYAGINNPISIAVPGIPTSALSATISNGTLTRNGDTWVARPAKVGSEAVVTVTATMDGRQQTVGSTTFRVRRLPDPMPYIAFKDANGNADRYKGGKPFSKALLLQSHGVSAAIDDDMLNVPYTVLGFSTVFFDQMGNAMPEVSNGSAFSQRQIDKFRTLQRGKRFYITNVRAKGPDGIERTLGAIEVIVQ